MLGRFLLASLGLFQGFALAMLPSASLLLTSKAYYQLSLLTYGLLFLPIVLAALIAFYGPSRRCSPLFILGTGIVCNIIALLLFAMTNIAPNKYPINILILIGVAIFQGIGFGSVFRALHDGVKNSYFGKEGISKGSIPATLALGSAVCPLLLNLFWALDLWWIAPIVALSGMLLIFNFAIFLRVIELDPPAPIHGRSISWVSFQRSQWLFLLVVLLYGVCESVVSVWTPIYLNQAQNLSLLSSNTALAFFWVMVALGRIILILSNFKHFYRLILTIFPIVLFWTLGSTTDYVWMLGGVGMACSMILPACFAFSKQVIPEDDGARPSAVMIAYLAGVVFGSVGLGLLLELGALPLESLFTFATIPAGFMTLFSWALLRLFPSPNEEGNSRKLS